MSQAPQGTDIVGSCSTETLEKLKQAHKSGFFLLISQNGCGDCQTMRDVLGEVVKDRKPVIEAPVEDQECNDLAKQVLKDEQRIVTPSILYYEVDQEPKKIIPDGKRTWDDMRKEIRELAERSSAST